MGAIGFIPSEILELQDNTEDSYTASVSRTNSIMGSATTTIQDDFIGTYIQFSGYLKSFDNSPPSGTFLFQLNNITIMTCSLAPQPEADAQDKANETLYLPHINVRKGSTIKIVTGGMTGNVNSGTFILGGYKELK